MHQVGLVTVDDPDAADVTKVLEEHYGDAAVNSWYGHPARLTVEGKTVKDASNEA